LSFLTITAWFLVAIVILVSIHELGHFSVARLCGVKVLRFSIGFGRRLVTYTDKRGTEYALSLIPLGGYVKMLDEREGNVDPGELPYSYNRQPVWQRIAILAAGPAANFILAFFLYSVLFMNGTSQLVPVVDHVREDSLASAAGLEKGQEILAVDGVATKSESDVMTQLINRLGESGELMFTVKYSDSKLSYDIVIEIDGWLRGTHAPDPLENLGFSFFRPIGDTKIAEIVKGGAAERAGFQVGDELFRVDGVPIGEWDEWVRLVKASPEKALMIDVLRNEAEVELRLVPDARVDKGQTYGFAGVGFFDSVTQSVNKTWTDTHLVLLSIKKLIVGEISTKNLSGPIGIAKVAASRAQHGLIAFIAFLAYLSVVLGVMNLLPIPVLDGGHIVYCLIELVSGKPVSEKIQLVSLQVGLAVLGLVMAVAFYNDIVRV